jgi:adenylate kinase family enzyme
MKRVVVIGSGGSGKSTFSRRLSEATGLEVIHLDSIFWRPNWERTPKDEWERKVLELVERDSWIMDGNFGSTREIRFDACDTVIFLDLPRPVCMYRVIKRAIKYRGRSRPDMAEGCSEKIDLEFLSWVWNFPKHGRSRILGDLRCLLGKSIYILKSKGEAESFLARIADTGINGSNGIQA